MRVTIAHNQDKEHVVAAINRGIDDALKYVKSAPVEILDLQRSWDRYVLHFSFTAKAGFFKGPVHGTVEVADAWIVIIADLGKFAHFLREENAQAAIEAKVRQLLG